ncbi:MAG: PTS system fructose-specific IIC component [Bacteroidia bacterium]|jgi:PTS system fructose-specific IIC component
MSPLLPLLSNPATPTNPLLTLSVVILSGMALGMLAKRIHLPSVTGQIIAGVIIGKVGFDLFTEAELHELQPLTHFALSLMAVTIGAHLNIRRLRNAGRRLFLLLLTESIITPAIVFSCLYFLVNRDATESALYATLAISTAPATIVAVVKESRSKGVFVKTLVAAVALNNLACVFLFELARAYATSNAGPDGTVALSLATLRDPALQLVNAALIGGGVALVMEAISRFVVRKDLLTTASVICLLFASGAATSIGVSPLLTCLFLGFVQTNLSSARNRLVDSVFSEFEPVILAIFFTLAGMHLSLDQITTSVALVAGTLFAARAAGKYLSADIAMRFSGVTKKVRQNLGLALMPQAGVAIGLVILVQEDPALADFASVFAAVVLTVVTINELTGPVLTKFALSRSGEAGMERVRLLDFIHEENIQVNFNAPDMEDAIDQLVRLLISSHHLTNVSPEELKASVLEREAQMSTCLGGGLAVPHGILPDNVPMVGVMALSKTGLDFGAPDGKPVRCLVLLATPPGERKRHLEVLATLAKIIGIDPLIGERLINAKSAAHAYEILHGEETEDFNYFLE